MREIEVKRPVTGPPVDVAEHQLAHPDDLLGSAGRHVEPAQKLLARRFDGVAQIAICRVRPLPIEDLGGAQDVFGAGCELVTQDV